MAKIFFPPKNAPNEPYKKSLFLAGTIDNGNSSDWQTDLFEYIKNLNVVVYNPRRADWDSTWEPVIENEKFKEQVDWELDHLNKSDIIVFNFEPNSVSPITLLELGYHIRNKDKKIFIRAPNDYWRSGNIKVMALRHNIPVYESFNDLLYDLSEYLLQS